MSTREAPVLADAEARRRIVEDLDTTFFVEAAAGTGKTTALVGRIVAVLARGLAPLERIVALTFSERAASEMKLRLRAEIERARSSSADPVVRGRLEAALEQLEVAHIDTIHSFCADLLREHPLAAGVDPLFEVTSDEDADGLVRAAFDAWFERVLDAPPEGVRRVLRRRSGGLAQTPRQQLLRAAEVLIQQRDFAASWRRDPFDREAAIDAVLAALERVASLSADAEFPDDWLAKGVADVARYWEELQLQERVRGRDHDALEAELRGFARARSWNWKGRARKKFSETHSRDEVLALRSAAKQALDELLERCEADLAPRLREELRDVVAGYEAAKARAGKLDFLDLLLRARDVVRDDADVRSELQQRFQYFFVDEFQDTDPLQVDLLLLLASADPAETAAGNAIPQPGKLFVVGDPKQSIYRFRRADIAIYRGVMDRLCAHGAQVLHLSASFRGVPAIQQAVNAAFEPAMDAAALAAPHSQAEYTALDRVRAELPGQPAVVALPVPAPYGQYGDVRSNAIEASFPDAVAAFVAWLCQESGWQVSEPGSEAGTTVPIEPRHICVLFRRLKRFRDDVTRDYVRALEARRVPHVLLGGRSFHEREEVLALRNALFAIEWPDDSLRVYAALRGPLFALGDDQLLAFRHRQGPLHPLRRFDRAALEDWEREVADALDVLGHLHVGRNHRSVAQTIGRLLEAVRAHAGIAIWPTGEQALANCLRVVDLARRFERRTARSFRAFVEHLEAQAESGEAQDAPVVEDGSDGVRLMTVHKAKGLEFPVVILADPGCRATHDRPDHTTDPERGLHAQMLCGCAPVELLERAEEEGRRDGDEALRVAYVAATRARDLLVVPVVGDAKTGLTGIDGGDFWLDVLAPAVFPPSELRRNAAAAPEAWGVPAFGDDSVAKRRGQRAAASTGSVQPGVHAPAVGAHHVLWWDPSALALDAQLDVGLRQEKILHADAKAAKQRERIQESTRAHEQWQRARSDLLAGGAAPSLRVQSVTGTVRAEQAPAAGKAASLPVEVERVEGKVGGRPRGRRFGTLVHAVLAEVPFDADAGALQRSASLQGRLIGASADEIDAAAAAARGALEHPILVRAAACTEPGALHRESPLWLRDEHGMLFEGIVDLAFRERAGDGSAHWSVVDFKTDSELDAHRVEYERQVSLYAEAIARATGEEARAILLQV